jgi:hypothetical protein
VVLNCAKVLSGLACQSHRVDICPATGRELDAVQFCRVVSARERGEGLLVVRVPFSDRWDLVRGAAVDA